MTPKLVIEQVNNYMVIYAQVPAWSLALGYLSIGVIGLWLYLRRKK